MNFSLILNGLYLESMLHDQYQAQQQKKLFLNTSTLVKYLLKRIYPISARTRTHTHTHT